MNVYVARHGETDWNRVGRYQGQRESSLTLTGRRQADALAGALGTLAVSRIISSPLRRCTDTARPLGAARSLQVEADAHLLEIAHGTWEGRLRADIEREDPDTLRRWREAPQNVTFDGGESLEDVLSRWKVFACALAGKNDIVVVTHDVLVRLAILEGTHRPLSMFWEPRVVNGGFARFAVEGGAWALLDECVDGHLSGLFVDPTVQAL
ncbi:MAG: histidine phosphatase family protein [Candidatus Baltobacteraceae bacterium]